MGFLGQHLLSTCAKVSRCTITTSNKIISIWDFRDSNVVHMCRQKNDLGGQENCQQQHVG